jgi:Na+/H+ antiporter NhaD/arsenite permease-like protein
MALRQTLLAILAVALIPAVAQAAGDAPLDLSWWSAVPFVLLLLAIAVLPLVAPHWWHRNRNRALVAALLAVPAAFYLLYMEVATGQPTLDLLGHEVHNYISFIILLGSLYTVSGGIVIAGDLQGRPGTNTGLLAFGAALANLIGTTGASVLLIRPLLRINRERKHTVHLPIFFIFTVSNLGGLLTPLGDPPLFLGFLNGVPFFWTLALWPHWLVANGLVLAVFFAWDTLAYRRELPEAVSHDRSPGAPLAVRGLANVLLLAGIMAGVVLQGMKPDTGGEDLGTILMIAMGLLSLLLTPSELRIANGFTWGPMVEVGILFAGIFVTMVPALELLGTHGKEFGLSEPWQFFWLTGVLSGFLDNAPTYLAFATMASGSTEFGELVNNQVPGLNGPLVLQAISCGAVFMGALTYVGNGPNFMVKAMADEAGYRTPTFFGYLAYSCLVLVPIFVLVTFIFFRPA